MNKSKLMSLWAFSNVAISIYCVLWFNVLRFSIDATDSDYVMANDWYGGTMASWAFFWLIAQKDIKRGGGTRVVFLNEITYRFSFAYIMLCAMISGLICLTMVFNRFEFLSFHFSGEVVAGMWHVYYPMLFLSVYVGFLKAKVPNWLK